MVKGQDQRHSMNIVTLRNGLTFFEQVCQRVQVTPVNGHGPAAPEVAGKRLVSPLNWMGGKAVLARQIVALLPPHDTYVEPFLGGGAVFLAKKPAISEIINDIHGE